MAYDGGEAGFAYLVPNPAPQLNAITGGELLFAVAIADPSGLNLNPFGVPPKLVEGSAYLVPNPEEVTGYAVTKFEVFFATIRSLVTLLKEIVKGFALGASGNVVGFANRVPNPVEDDQG
jgi:hypothetical protein